MTLHNCTKADLLRLIRMESALADRAQAELERRGNEKGKMKKEKLPAGAHVPDQVFPMGRWQ